MNKIVFDTHIWTDSSSNVGDGRLLSGTYDIENSLAHDELNVDTIRFKVRYPLGDVADTSLLNYPYGTRIQYYQDADLLSNFYLVNKKRTSKFEYEFEAQSGMGLLADSMHYGGIYNGETAGSIISNIIGDKAFYTVKPIFNTIKIYGWLPIATRKDNLQQLLFACGGCVKKNNGEIYITTLDVTTPETIPTSRTMEGGNITYDEISKVEMTEHGFFKGIGTDLESLFEGELDGSNFVTPKGYTVTNAAIVTWDGPHYDIEYTGCRLLNREEGVNYAVVSAGPNVIIKGKPYTHTENIVYREKPNYTGKEKVATITDATLISLANSGAVAERVLAYYGNSDILQTSFITEGERTADRIRITNPFGELSEGYIKKMEGDFGNHVNKVESEVALNYFPPTIIGSRTLTGLTITTPPTQTSYATGDYFNTAGMVVTASYDDGSTQLVSNYRVTPETALSLTDTNVTISYTEIGVTVTAVQPITVKTVLRRIAVTTPPDVDAYWIGDYFDPTGMVVRAYYSDQSTRIITNYTYTPTRALTANDDTVVISYTEDGITATTNQDITVGAAPNLVSIAVTKAPNRVKYNINESFSTAGMVVTAHFDDSTSKTVSGYTYSPSGALQPDDTSISISYTRGGITKTTSQPITVVYLDRIEVTNPPTYTNYNEDDSFNKFGMEVTAFYSDGTLRVLSETDYVVTPTILTTSNTYVTITYSETGQMKTTTQAVSVVYPTHYKDKSIVISTSGTYHLSDFGATHRDIRVVCIGGGGGGQGGKNGSSGSSGTSGSISSGNNGNSGSTSGGSGGSGGAGGSAGIAGKIYEEDIILNAQGDDIVISIGSAGSGGSVGGNAGGTGGNTTTTINSRTISSASGSTSDSGYTNTIQDPPVTYALPGENGTAGGSGGKGGGSDSNGSSGNSDETGTHSGGNGGSGNSTSASNSYQTTDTGGSIGTYPQTTITMTVTQVIQTGSKSGCSSITKSGYDWDQGRAGTYSKTVYNDECYSLATSGSSTVSNSRPGKVYSSVSASTRPSNAPYVTTTQSKSFTSYEYTTAALITHSNSVKTTYKGAKTTVSSTYKLGGGGGGGASASANGSTGGSASTSTKYGGSGGKGAAAPNPSVPTTYGSAGSGGFGGGGGGGGASVYITVSGNTSWAKYSTSATRGSGGSGGSGSAGSGGMQGCVIIYYS